MTSFSDDYYRALGVLEGLQYESLKRLGMQTETDIFSLPLEKIKEIMRTMRPDQFGRMSDAELIEYISAMREQGLDDGSTPRSRYEHAGLHVITSRLLERIYAAMGRMGVDAANRPIVGTLRTGRVNGMAIAAKDASTRIILLDHGLFGFANLMCKAVAMAIPITDGREDQITYRINRDDVMAHLATTQEPVRRFFDAIGSYIVEGDPHRAEQYSPGPELDAFASIMRDSMELFILGHELGHVIHGHLDGSTFLSALPGEIETLEISTRWEQEFEADLFGIAMAVQAQLDGGYDLSLSFLGADLFFSCIDIVERTVDLLDDGVLNARVGTSHPPTRMRRDMIRLWLSESVGKQHSENAKAALELSDLVTEIVESYWSSIEPAILRMHADGVRPVSWFH